MAKLGLYGLSGVNSPLPHQIAVKELLCYIDKKLKDNYSQYDVVSESDVRSLNENEPYFNKNSDIVIWKKSKEHIEKITEPVIIIEITNKPFPANLYDTNNYDINKIESYFLTFPSLKESILYNYREADTSKNTIRFIRAKNNVTPFRELGTHKIQKFGIILPTYLL